MNEFNPQFIFDQAAQWLNVFDPILTTSVFWGITVWIIKNLIDMAGLRKRIDSTIDSFVESVQARESTYEDMRAADRRARRGGG